MQISACVVEDCQACKENTKEGIIISTSSSFFGGPKAIVAVGGKLEEVAIDRLFDVKEII
jgi:hypothetical protein